MTVIYNKQKQKVKRRILRKNSTGEEKILWCKLKNKQLGIRFRRQYGIGSYIVDFCSPKNKIVIEIDGEIHSERAQSEYDREREKVIKELEFNILRFKNTEIRKNLDKVIEKIRNSII